MQISFPDSYYCTEVDVLYCTTTKLYLIFSYRGADTPCIVQGSVMIGGASQPLYKATEYPASILIFSFDFLS